MSPLPFWISLAVAARALLDKLGVQAGSFGGGSVTIPTTYEVNKERLFGSYWKNRRPCGLPPGVRATSVPGGAMPALRALLSGSAPGFQKCVLALARHESGGTFALPAVTFCHKTNDFEECDCNTNITSWGVFQYNAGAWRSLDGIGNQRFPWEATPEQELSLPVAQFAKIWNANPGDDRHRATAVYLYFQAPAYYRKWRNGEPYPDQYVKLTESRLREAGF